MSEPCFAKLKAKHPSRGFLKPRGKQKNKEVYGCRSIFFPLQENVADFGNPRGVGVLSIVMTDSMEHSYYI